MTGNVQYLDVGLKLEVEPTIHLDNDVAIKVNLEVSTIVKEINTSSGTLAYQIGTRNASTLLRLKDGETQILAGLISDEERKSASKIPGLGDIPIVGRLFSSHKNDDQKTEIVLSITPRLVRNIDRPDARTTQFWFGTENSMRSGPLSVEPVATGRAAAAAVPAPAAPSPKPTETNPVPPASKPDDQAKAAGAIGTAPADASVVTWQGPSEVKAGEQFELMMNLKSPEDLAALTFQLKYDPSALELVSVDEGDLSIENAQASSFKREIDAAAGKLRVDLVPPSGGSLRGEGSIALVTFKAISANAKSPLAMSSLLLTGKSGKPLPASLPGPYPLTLVP